MFGAKVGDDALGEYVEKPANMNNESNELSDAVDELVGASNREAKVSNLSRIRATCLPWFGCH